ncbi:MAG: S-methyl-5-thioribose-1-phosphate isomerase [Candidatus Susulua stagnicola]|nr:S-methyl-5-thioribose-1-phosphate isomerase [Candidatus Susulua stagnicola]
MRKNTKFSPLFWPIKLKGNIIYILDETLLPHQEKYIKAKNYLQACLAIRQMKTRAVGQVILVMYIFLMVFKNNKDKKNISSLLNRVAKAINSTRPTLSFEYLTNMVLGWQKKSIPLDKAILGFLDILKNARIKQAKQVVEFVKDGDVILTHCNVSGLMPLIAEFAKDKLKSLKFFVTETRPYLQGSRLTAWELMRAGFDVTVITDNMVAQVMEEGKINKVIVGSDNLAQNGDIANKIGTYQIALIAKYFKIPFYVLCAPVSSAKTGKDIKIEIRPDKELTIYQGVYLAPRGSKAYYPAFDITPNNLITKHIYLEVKNG